MKRPQHIIEFYNCLHCMSLNFWLLQFMHVMFVAFMHVKKEDTEFLGHF